MQIHIACDVSAEDKNPFLQLLTQALRSHSTVAKVTTGVGDVLKTTSPAVDVLHVHWPEAFTDWEKPTCPRLEAVATHLDTWRKHTQIATTIHNRLPHGRHNAAFWNLYNTVYTHTQGFIHLGEASRHVLAADHPSASRNADHVIIPHGRYTPFEQDVNRCEARRKLGYGKQDFVALTFGALREPEELDLVVRGFARCPAQRKRLLIASRISWPSRKRLTYYRLRGHLLADPRIHVEDRFIPDDEVAYFLRAADALIVPRFNALNSGNVALGFTFGTVVVGPQYGVVGEVLARRNNPTYAPGDPAALGRSLQNARRARSEGVGEANERYARDHWNWETIAEQHVSFYQRLLQDGPT